MADTNKDTLVSLLTDIADGFRTSRSLTSPLSLGEMAELAAVPIGSTENKLAQCVDNTVTEITAKDLEGATSLRERAFYQLTNLVSVELPDSIIGTTGGYVFQGCTNLTTITLGKNINRLGNRFAYGASNLSNVYIPNEGVTFDIYDAAFQGIKTLKTITLPNRCTRIGTQAFWQSGLQQIRIGNFNNSAYLYSIASNAFQDCTALTDIYIDVPEGTISGAPWGAKNATVHWNTPLPSNG